MFCGFGAVVLLVLIINTHVVQARSEQFVDLRSEVIRLEHEVIVGEENLVEIRNALAATDTEIEQVRGQTDRSRDTTSSKRRLISGR